MKRLALGSTLALVALAAAASDHSPQVPSAVVDLRTDTGARAVQADWSYRDAAVVAGENRAVGGDLRPSGAPIPAQDLAPRPGTAAFAEASAWEKVTPAQLEARRTHGKFAAGWYRLRLTLPEKIGGFAVAGSTAVFEVSADDYSEIWVDGAQPRALGQVGEGLVSGWNAPNRVVLTRRAEPGRSFDLALFVANAPLSDPPANFVWLRSATLDFYPPGRFEGVEPVALKIDRRDPGLDAVLRADAKLERLANGFVFTEGPVWVRDGQYLLFSDPNRNVIYRLSEAGEVSIYRAKSGYAGFDIGEYRQPGSNGLTLDKEGRLTIAEHGNRRVSRLEKNGTLTVLAERYQGKRLNSPNDLVYRSDGTLFFTDPPFGLPKVYGDARRELPFFGVFCLRDGEPRLVADELRGPNGIAFSPDERYLYVANWDERKKIVTRYAVDAECRVSERRLFFDLTAEAGEEALDGLKVDSLGNLYLSGPQGLWIVSPAGKLLGLVQGPELAANFAFGDADGRSLFWAARGGIYRLRLEVPGIHP